MRDIDIAKDLLKKNNVSLVIVKNGEIILEDTQKGIKPLLEAILEKNNELTGASLADKVIGKAAAMLCVKGGIKEVYARIISEDAIEILQENKVALEYTSKVPYIQNRTKTDLCPIEKMAKGENDVEKLIKGISQFIKM